MAQKMTPQGGDALGQSTIVPQTSPALNGIDRNTGLLMIGETRWFGRGLVILGWVAMLLFAGHACTRMVAAGDTWVAMACGRHFVNHGVDTVEPFSANSHHAGPTEAEVATWPGWAQKLTKTVGLDTVRRWHPTGWVNQNWLTHIIFYKLATGLGSEEEPYYNALVYWKFAIYILAVVCIYASARILGVQISLAAAGACFALYVGRTFLDVRPAGFSNLLVAVFVLILILATYRHTLFIWLIVPLAVFWGGVHGGYIYIFIVMLPFIALHAFTTLPKRWTSWLYFFLGWLFFCGMVWKGLEHYRDIAERVDTKLLEATHGGTIKIVVLVCLLGATGLALACLKRFREQTVYVYHAIASGLVFLLLLFRLFPEIPFQLNARYTQLLNDELSDARLNLFVLFVTFIVFSVVFVFLKSKLKAVSLRTVYHMLGAYGIALLAAILFNPFHLTNLTHTFIVSVSKHAERWRNVHEWHPAFNWTNPVGTAMPFLVLCIIGVMALLVWFVAQLLARRTASLGSNKLSTDADGLGFQWPKLDIPLVAISGLTMYMAIRSRRFIPIAAFSMLPIVVYLLHQTVCTALQAGALRRGRSLSRENLAHGNTQVVTLGLCCGLLLLGLWYLLFWGGRYSFTEALFIPIKGSHLYAPRITLVFLGVLLGFIGFLGVLWYYLRSQTVRDTESARNREIWESVFLGSASLVLAFVLGFGLWASRTYKRIYLDAWPGDAELNSVFMRMTASHLKPFDACTFIRENKLCGNMMNYWTEGGFIAFGQQPDPETGKTPLQLFMDGRAQAAYTVDTFNEWSKIWAGGEVGYKLRRENRLATADDWKQMGQWINKELKRREVWVVMVPMKEWNSHFIRGLTYAGNWRIPFINNKQKIFVNVDTPQGAALMKGIGSGETVYPDEFTRILNEAHMLLVYGSTVEQKRKGFEAAVRAFKMKPSAIPAMIITEMAGRSEAFRAEIVALGKEFLANFEANVEEHAQQHGFQNYLDAAYRLTEYLRNDELKRGNTEVAEIYLSQRNRLMIELRRIGSEKRW
ncbi:hypothetical protein ACFL6U_13905 [Planctomycetota bacterium]